MKTRILLAVIVLSFLASGCTESITQESYGNNTEIEYDNSISQERIEGIHSALVERGWDSNKANVTTENASWYTVNLQTDIEESRVRPGQQYSFQQTATLIEYNSFRDNETLQLRSYNRNGKLISVFTQ